MSDQRIGPSTTAAQLRRAFDQSFAEAALTEAVALEDFLAIRLGADPHALRLVHIAHVLPLSTITRFPSPVAELMGVIGFRGAIVPVYDFRMLLGYARQEESPGWLVIAAAWPLALAFDAFDGHLRVPREASARHASAEHSRRHVQEVLHINDTVRPIVSLPSVIETIRTSVQLAAN
jgi:chemotaxis signal transduction protein